MSVIKEYKAFLASLEELEDRQGKKPLAECREHYANLTKEYLEFRMEKMNKLSLALILEMPEVTERLNVLGKNYPDLHKKFDDAMNAKMEIPEGIEDEENFPEKLKPYMDGIRKQSGN